MTPTSARIAEDFTARFYRGEPIVLELQLEDADGAPEDLASRTFFAALYRSSGEVFDRAAGVVAIDTNERPYLTCAFNGDISDALYGEQLLRYAIGEMHDSGNNIIVDGALIILPAPTGLVAGSNTIVDGIATRFVRRLEIGGRSRIVVSERGPAGLSAAQIAVAANDIDEPTPEAFMAHLRGTASDVAREVAFDQVGNAITELGEFTSERSAEIDAAISDVGTVGVIVTSKGKYAEDQGKYAKAQGDAIGDISGAVAVTGAAKLATEKARDQVANTAGGLRFDLTSTLYTPWGKKVAFARVDPNYGVGDMITEEGVHHANYSIRVNGATWARGFDGFWTLDLSALALAKYSFASGDVIEGTKTRYYKGKKVNWAVVDKNLAVALCVTDDGKVYAEDFESPATDITKAIFSQVTFNTGETIVTSTVTRYYNGQPVTWARTDKDGRASIVELASGKVVIPDFESPALDLAGGNAPLETQGYVFAEVLVAGTKQVQRYSKATGKGSVATSTGNNFAPRLSFDGSKVVFLSDRSGVKEGWYQQLDGSKFGGAVTHPVVARKTITAVGDSLTAGDYAGLVAQTFGTSQTTPSSAPVDGSLVSAGGGIGSQQSPQIAARFGAVGNLTCSLAGGTMVDGANTLTAVSINLIGRAGDQAGAIRYLRASILGVSGWLKSAQQSTSANGALPSGDGFYLYTFTPDAGQALPVAVPANTSLVIDPENRQDSILLIWAGSNDVGNPGWQATVKAMIASMIAVHKPLVPNYLVLSILNSVQRPAGNAQHDEIVAFNLELAAIYGDNYVDVRTPYNAGTADDTPNPAYSIDGLHYNNAGRAVIAAPVIARIQTKGWFS